MSFASISISGFRSIRSATLRLAPITVLFGPTAAGKSSLFYSIMVLRNFLLNPNQGMDGFFNLGFQQLGGFDQCVFNRDAKGSIDISLGLSEETGYGIRLRKAEAELQLTSGFVRLSGKVQVPYPLNQQWPFSFKVPGNRFTANWNGLFASVTPDMANAQSQELARDFAEKINSVYERVKQVDICPHRRGFFKPSYSPVQLSLTPTSEDEVATLILNDDRLGPLISQDLQAIFQRDFRTHVAPGTATGFLQTTSIDSRVPTYLVNDGFGVNQVVYMLAKIYRAGVDVVLIEEPEVHLHPTVIRSMARVACRVAKEEGKQLMFTTHSEHFLLALLALVASGEIPPDMLACYEVDLKKKETVFHEQKVSPNGQIEGGLSAFMAGELEDLKKFLDVHS